VESPEVLVSVDIEASGPSPSTGSLIAIGACLVDDPDVSLYLHLKPLPGVPWSEEAQRVHGLSQVGLLQRGLDAPEAMRRLDAWLSEVSVGRQPVFAGWNAGFDWMFVADYFERYLGRNPFGIAPLDFKAYLMGRDRLTRWADTRRSVVAERYGQVEPVTHNALDDARRQATFIRRLMRQDDQTA
jgi:DNA polymerase III epsilon subunit-like protein